MISKELVAASAKPLILSILSKGESYGYEIIQQVRELSEGEMEWKDGMLYPVLHRLKAQGLIEDEWRVSETGRKRKYYRLGEQGLKILRAEERQWMSVHETLMKLWRGNTCLT